MCRHPRMRTTFFCMVLCGGRGGENIDDKTKKVKKKNCGNHGAALL